MAEPKAKGARPQLRLTLPPRPVEEVQPAGPDEAPFFRPKSRTRVRRARHSLFGRGLLVLQIAAVAVLLASALWTGYARAMSSERLKVAHVDVRGERFLSQGEVVQLLGPAVGENILALDLDALKAKLRASPWVADAIVRRTLPDTLKVDIRERVPLALAAVDRLYLMDGDGTLIDIYGPRTATFDLPIVRGLPVSDGDARRDRAQRAGTLLRDLGALGAEISEVQVEDGGDLRVVLRGPGEVLRMGTPPFRKRFVTFLSLRKDLAERCPNAEYFDLRFKDRIYAKEPETPASPKTELKNAAKAPVRAAPASAGIAPEPPAASQPIDAHAQDAAKGALPEKSTKGMDS
jgi:cell division protein FtsQ